VLDKPAGPTSHGCVARVRRAYRLKRVGHGGTLDPAVTGVLPIAVGAATRLLPYLSGTKAYRGSIQLGLRTSSDDLEGEVLAQFRGPIQQRPPLVSAVHVDGERAYRLVQRGEQPELAPRPVTIEQLELLAWDPQQQRLEIQVRCSAGTYIRALARDLGEALGCGGSLAWLQRTEALGFPLSAALPLEALDAAIAGLAAPPRLLDPLLPLQHLGRHQLSNDTLASWRCGRRLEVPRPAAETGEPVVVLDPTGALAGMARSEGAAGLQPKLVLHAAG